MSQAHRSPAPPSVAPFALLSLMVAVIATGCATPAPSAPVEAPAAQTPPAAAPAPAAPSDPPPPAAATAVPDAPPAEVRCFFGTTVQRQPDGTERPGAELMVRHREYPDDALLVEDSVRYDRGTPETRVSRYRVLMEVDPEAGSFTLRETDGLYTGRGRLEGEPWAWDAWTFSYRLASGITVEGRYELREGDGGGTVLQGEKRAYGPDGGLALTLVETLPETEPAECEERITGADGRQP